MSMFDSIIFDEFNLLSVSESFFSKKMTDEEFDQIYKEFIGIVDKLEKKISSTENVSLTLIAYPQLLEIRHNTENAKQDFKNKKEVNLKYFVDMNFTGKAIDNNNYKNKALKEIMKFFENEGYFVNKYNASKGNIIVYFIHDQGSDLGFVFEYRSKIKKK